MKKFYATQVAKSTPFEPVTNISATDTQEAVEAHVGRHNPNGADAIATANVETLTPDLLNSEGSASSVARSDHVHNVPTESAVTVSTNGTNAEGNANSFARSNHTHKTEVYFENAQATGNVTTTSTSDVLLTSMSLTPPAGTYLVSFFTSIDFAGNNAQAFLSLYVGGIKQGASEVTGQVGPGAASGLEMPMTIVEFPVTVNGSQAIEVRWRRSGGSSITAQVARSLTAKRVD